MSLIDSIPEKLGSTEPWIEKGGVHWLTAGALNVRDLARVMNGLHARFVTITAYQLPGEEGLRLEYHWDLDGQLLGFPFLLSGNSIDAVDFLGREYEPLLLRQGETPGVNLREEVKK